MDFTFVIDVVSRITHVLTAIMLLGGSMFSVWVLAPAASRLEEPARETLLASVIGRWKWYVHLGILLFLVSGGYNYWRAIPLHRGDGLYHALLGVKMLLALGVFFIAAALVGRAEAFQSMRDRRIFWTRTLVLLAVVIVTISGFVKVRGPSRAAEINPPGENLDVSPPVAADAG